MNAAHTCTRVYSKPQWDFAATYKIVVDDFFLRYLAMDVMVLELNLVSVHVCIYIYIYICIHELRYACIYIHKRKHGHACGNGTCNGACMICMYVCTDHICACIYHIYACVYVSWS
jgi:hypothetical protein